MQPGSPRITDIYFTHFVKIKRELRLSERWSNVILAIYIEASLLKAVCYPLIHQDNDWKESLEMELKVQQKNLGEIGATIKEKLTDLDENRINNAYRALSMWLDEKWNQYETKDGNTLLMIHVYEYLNDNFNYGGKGNVTKFNVVVVRSTNVTDRSPDLFYYSKSDDKSVVVGFGKIWDNYSCDRQIDNVLKKLTCFKIGDKVISYDLSNYGKFCWDCWSTSLFQ